MVTLKESGSSWYGLQERGYPKVYLYDTSRLPEHYCRLEIQIEGNFSNREI